MTRMPSDDRGRRLYLPPSVRDALIAQFYDAFPHEACGLLFGSRQGGDVYLDAYWPTPNLADNPRRRFEIDPRLLVAAQKRQREPGHPALLGYAHSHPAGLARPSAADRAGIATSGEIWLIGAVDRYPRQVRVAAFETAMSASRLWFRRFLIERGEVG